MLQLLAKFYGNLSAIFKVIVKMAYFISGYGMLAYFSSSLFSSMRGRQY